MESKIDSHDRIKVLNYMMSFHCGYKNAKHRQEIATTLEMEDRYFRLVCETIPEIISSCHRGYWILPLVDTTGAEVKAARDVLKYEARHRVISLYLRMRKQRQAINKVEGKEVQLEMELVNG